MNLWFCATLAFSSIVQQQEVTLPELIRFKTASGKLREQIGAHYRDLGCLLLNDKKGEVTRTIIKSHGPDAIDIITEIFQQWIEGKGMAVEWATLIEVLKDIGLVELAREVEQILKWMTSFLLTQYYLPVLCCVQCLYS